MQNLFGVNAAYPNAYKHKRGYARSAPSLTFPLSPVHPFLKHAIVLLV